MLGGPRVFRPASPRCAGYFSTCDRCFFLHFLCAKESGNRLKQPMKFSGNGAHEGIVRWVLTSAHIPHSRVNRNDDGKRDESHETSDTKKQCRLEDHGKFFGGFLCFALENMRDFH